MSKKRGSEFYRPDDPEADAQMAPGNPTPLSTGQERAGMPDGYQPLGPIAPGAPDAASMAQGQQRAGDAHYALDPNYRPSQGPQQQGPSVRLRQTGWLGGSTVQESRTAAGDPIYMPQTAVPTFELQESLAGVRQDKEALNDWLAKQNESFSGKAADPYQAGYEQYVGHQQDQFVTDVADAYYGGDKRMAWRAIRHDPEINAQWQRNNRYLQAIGTANRSGWDRWAKIAEARDKGDIQLDQQTNDELEGMLDGHRMWNTDSPAESAYNIENLETRLSMNKYFDTFLRPNVPNAGDVLQEGGDVVSVGGRKMLEQTKTKDYDEFVDQSVKSMAPNYPNVPEEALRDFIESRVPRESVTTLKPLPVGKGSGNGGGTKEASTLTFGKGVMSVTDANGNERKSSEEYPMAILKDVTSGKGTPPNASEFYYPPERRKMSAFPIAVFRGSDGNLFLQAKVAPETRVAKADDGAVKMPSFKDAASGKEGASVEDFNRLRTVWIDLDKGGNFATLQSAFPSMKGQLTKEALNAGFNERTKKRPY